MSQLGLTGAPPPAKGLRSKVNLWSQVLKASGGPCVGLRLQLCTQLLLGPSPMVRSSEVRGSAKGSPGHPRPKCQASQSPTPFQGAALPTRMPQTPARTTAEAGVRKAGLGSLPLSPATATAWDISEATQT